MPLPFLFLVFLLVDSYDPEPPWALIAAFAWGAIATFATYRNERFIVDIDGERIDQICNNVIVANCRYFAGGMTAQAGVFPLL